MKARRVEGLDPDGPLAENAARIVRTRLAELCSYMPAVRDRKRMRDLHNMRIAAKRLRYVLELTAGCFGSYASQACARAEQLQDVLGDVHDCDVLIPRVERQLAESLGELNVRPGLELLIVRLKARRDRKFARFLALWEKLERSNFAVQLEKSLTQQPATADLRSGVAASP